MSEQTEELKRLREHLTYYEAAFALADRVSKVATLKRIDDHNFSMAFLHGKFLAIEQEFYGSRTAAPLVRLKAEEEIQHRPWPGVFPVLSEKNVKEAERDLDGIIRDYENALDLLEEKRYGSKLAALYARLERMEKKDGEE